MDKTNQDTKDEMCATYRRKIIKMVEKIDNPAVLIKIYTVAKTHLDILREMEQGD